MQLISDFGAMLSPAPHELSSRCIWHWRARDLSVDAPLTGHRGTFTRGATLAFVDSNGVSMTAHNAEPAWQPMDLDGDSVRDTMCVLCGSSDRWRFESVAGGIGFPPQATSGYIDFVENGGRVASAGATLFAICNDAVSGGRFWIDTTGTGSGFYRANYHNGTTSVSSTIALGQPSSGQRVRLSWYQLATGQLRLSQRIGSAAPTDGSESGPISLLAWGAGAVIRLNSRGDTENPSTAIYREAALVSGLLDFDTLIALR